MSAKKKTKLNKRNRKLFKKEKERPGNKKRKKEIALKEKDRKYKKKSKIYSEKKGLERNKKKVKHLYRKKLLKKKISLKREKALMKEEEPKEIKSNLKRIVFRPKIKVIGIGGGGCAIVSAISHSLKKSTFLLADTDIRSLQKRGQLKYLLFGQEITHGLGTGGDVNIAKEAAKTAKEKISNILKDQDIIIFIASLGGGVGSGATQIFAEIAQKYQGITFGIFTLPFNFEGKNKMKIAQRSFKILSKFFNVSLAILNEKIFKLIKPDTPIVEAFSMVNKKLVQSLESLIELIYTPGVINIDFADLKSILRGRGNLAFLNTIEESGKDRAEKICKKILTNPLLKPMNFVPEKILFNIAGSNNLSMWEVEKISKYIGEQNPQSKIIFGITQNNRFGNKIKVTILMTGSGKGKEEIQKDMVEKEKEQKRTELAKVKKISSQKREKKGKKKKLEIKPIGDAEKEGDNFDISQIPFEPSLTNLQEAGVKKMTIVETSSLPAKKAIRRTGLEIKKAEELEEERRLLQEEEWEIPTFLRKAKFNK